MYEDTPYDRRPSFFAAFFLQDKKPNGFSITFIVLFFIEMAGILFFVLLDRKSTILFFTLHKMISTFLVGFLVLSGYVTYRTLAATKEPLNKPTS
jgi:hypothetical protein